MSSANSDVATAMNTPRPTCTGGIESSPLPRAISARGLLLATAKR